MVEHDTSTAPPPPPEAPARPRLAETVGQPTRRNEISPVMVAGAARLLDFVLVATIGALITYLWIPAHEAVKPQYWWAVPGVALTTVVILQNLGVYRISNFRQVFRPALAIVGGYSTVFFALMAVVFFLKLEGVFSRVVFGGWFIFGLMALLVRHVLLNAVVRSLTRRGLLDRRTAIVGGGDHALELINALNAGEANDIRICGIFDDRDELRSPDLVAGYPRLGSVDDLIAYARNVRVDLVIFTLPVTAEERILAMLRKLWVLPVDIRLSAHTQRLRLRPRSYSFIGSVPMFDVADKPFNDRDIIIKALFDRVIGSLLLVLLSPVMLLAALAVKLDSPGPVLFRQKRYGFNNQLVEVLKFRSMHVGDADHDARKLVTRDDPRVTRVGRFLRRTSIDELPQLFNVVFGGSLSLVGPRPHAIHAKAENRLYDEVVDGYFARHKVKPGITGWAQINGWRGETDTREKIQRRVEHDLFYIENWSVLLDLYILIRTPFALINGDRAY